MIATRGVLHGWLLTAGLLVQAAAASTPDLLLYASFDGTAEAQVARGSPTPLVHGALAFGEGKFGQGYLAGAEGTELLYEATGNVDPLAGTVAMWVKPLTWSGGDAEVKRQASKPIAIACCRTNSFIPEKYARDEHACAPASVRSAPGGIGKRLVVPPCQQSPARY